MSDVQPELAKEFRCMLMHVARQLKQEEMEEIAYLEGYPNLLECAHSSGMKSVRVHFLHQLEAKGLFSPLKPDGLIAILNRIPRKDLLGEINKYKQHPLFTKATKKSKPKFMRKQNKDGPKDTEEKETVTKCCKHQQLEETFALAMTHASSLMVVLEDVRKLMELPLPEVKVMEITPKLEEAIATFSKEEQTVETISRTMRKVLSDSGINLPRRCSEEDSMDYPQSLAGSRRQNENDEVQAKALSLPRNIHSVHYKKKAAVADKIPLKPPNRKPLSGLSLRKQTPGSSTPLVPTGGIVHHRMQLVTGHERVSQIPPPVSPKPKRPVAYQNVQVSPTPVSEDNAYDIVEFTDDSGLGSGEKVWGDEVKTSLAARQQSGQDLDKDHLYENILKQTKPPKYMGLLARPESTEYCLPRQ